MTLFSFFFLLLLQPAGVSVQKMISSRRDVIVMSAGWLIGSAVATLFFFSLLVLGLDTIRAFAFTFIGVTLLALIQIVNLAYWLQWKELFFLVLPKTKNERTISILLLALILFIVVINLFWPHTDWDAMTLYDYRAKLLIEQGSLSPMLSSIQDLYLVSYPWYTSVLFVFVYILGAWNGMTIFSLLLISFLLTFFTIISKNSSRLTALTACLSLLTVPLVFSHGMIAYTNLPYTIFWGSGIVCLLSWIYSKNISDGLTGALLLGFCAWIRVSEPFWLIGVLLILYGMIKHRAFTSVLWLIPVFIIRRGWNQYVHETLKIILPSDSIELLTYEGKTQSFNHFLQILNIDRLRSVIEHLITYAVPLWGGWLLLLVMLFIVSFQKKKLLIPMGVACACVGAVIIGTYLFATNSYWNQIIDSFQRLLLFAFPVFVYISTLEDESRQEDQHI